MSNKAKAIRNLYKHGRLTKEQVEAAVPGLRLYSDLSNRALNEAIAAPGTAEKLAQAAVQHGSASSRKCMYL